MMTRKRNRGRIFNRPRERRDKWTRKQWDNYDEKQYGAQEELRNRRGGGDDRYWRRRAKSIRSSCYDIPQKKWDAIDWTK